LREAGRLATTATSPAGDRRLCTLAYKARIVSKLDAIRPPLWQWLEGRVASTVELGVSPRDIGDTEGALIPAR